MKKLLIALGVLIVGSTVWAFKSEDNKNSEGTCTLVVRVDGLRNSTGNVQYSLYNKSGTIPDEKYENYYLQKNGKIINGESKVIFENVPKGRYAINILHDEDKNGQIKKGWILPIEGVGFSNYSSIGLTNRPNFEDASFYLESDCHKKVKIIYM